MPSALRAQADLFLALDAGYDPPGSAARPNDVLVRDREQVALLDRQLLVQLCDTPLQRIYARNERKLTPATFFMKSTLTHATPVRPALRKAAPSSHLVVSLGLLAELGHVNVVFAKARNSAKHLGHRAGPHPRGFPSSRAAAAACGKGCSVGRWEREELVAVDNKAWRQRELERGGPRPCLTFGCHAEARADLCGRFRGTCASTFHLKRQKSNASSGHPRVVQCSSLS
jgi:hypothetical protein